MQRSFDVSKNSIVRVEHTTSILEKTIGKLGDISARGAAGCMTSMIGSPISQRRGN